MNGPFERFARWLRGAPAPQPAPVAPPASLEEAARLLAGAAAEQRDRLDALKGTLDGVGRNRLALYRRARTFDQQLKQLKAASARQHTILTQALKQADWDEELRIHERRMGERLSRLKRSTRPVLVGPWSGEVGFELLYWIPFVTWALRRADVSPDRIVIVSRGGPQSWYAHLGGRYIDALAHTTPDEFRTQTEAARKQRGVGPFDREILRRVLRSSGLSRPMLLHPGLMYRLFYPFWKQKTTVHRVERFTEFQPIARPHVPELAPRLPKDYIAVRFYFSSSFPDTPENRAFVEATLKTLAAAGDVVLLNTPFHIDDHRDFVPGKAGRVRTVGDLMDPVRNLEVQTAVIAGARAFVGTYGGYAYLAPLCGVPSLAFYSVRDAFFAHHLQLADRVFRRLEAPSLAAIDVRDTALLRLALQASISVPT